MKPKVKKTIHLVFIITILCVFLFAVWKIVGILRSYSEADKTYEDIFEQFVVINTDGVTSDPETEKNTEMSGEASSDEPMSSPDSEQSEPQPSETKEHTVNTPLQINFEGLKAYNPDVVGWLYCEGTPINYPVLQGGDNDYYLRHMINGEYNIAGSVFMDYRCDAGLNDLNTIIYGHNFNNDIMFGSFLKYKKQSYYDEHPVILYYTEQRNYRLELIAGFITPSDSPVYLLQDSTEKLEKFIEECRALSTFSPNEESKEIGKIMVLSTCSNESSDTRYVLIANVVPME